MIEEGNDVMYYLDNHLLLPAMQEGVGMPVELTADVGEGIVFGAVSQDYDLRVPCIVIPVAAFEAMSDGAIGQAARQLLPLAELARALDFADNLNTNCGNTEDVPDFILEEKYAERRALLERFAGEEPQIDRAIRKIRAGEKRRSVAAARKTETIEKQRRRQERQEEAAAKKALSPAKAPRQGHVYIMHGDKYFKIGCTSNPSGRLHAMNVKSPFPIQVRLLIPHHDIEGLEAELHQRFTQKRLRGEWFDLTEEDIETLRCDYATVDHSQFNAG